MSLLLSVLTFFAAGGDWPYSARTNRQLQGPPKRWSGALTLQELKVPRMSNRSLLRSQILLPNARNVEELGILLLRRRDL